MPQIKSAVKPVILLTGATGYVGGRLKQCLENQDYPLRCLIRSKTIPLDKKSTTEYITADLSDTKALHKALDGVDIAYYLIHSLGSKNNFEEKDRELANYFIQAAVRCGVKKIIYLGGLGSHFQKLSPHLKSRQEVGHILRANASFHTQVIEFRASIVLGSGSVSYEMIANLVNRLPILLVPIWAYTELQPIAIVDLLQYLTKALTLNLPGHPILEIGGKERISYAGLMKMYAEVKNLKRWLIPIPFLSTKASSICLGLITPLYARVGKKLIESAAYATVVHDPMAYHLFKIDSLGIKESLQLALANENKDFPETRWNDTASATLIEDETYETIGNRIVDYQELIVELSAEEAFQPIKEMGGTKGYYFCNWLFHLRGFFDQLIGGVGFQRGRRDQYILKVGDVIDYWRIEEYKNNHYLKLKSELKIPGFIYLEFCIEPHLKGSKIIQRIFFDPAGIKGILYWYFFKPLRYLMLKGMLKAIARLALEKKLKKDQK